MRTMFGAPVGTLAVVLSVLAGLAIAIVAALALRNIVFFRLGVRNVRRRAGRTALIVVGLMLGTAIIAAALGTGDTMGRTVRSSVMKTLGNSDEWITAKGAKPDLTGAVVDSAGLRLFDARVTSDVERVARGTGLIDGVMPAIIRSVAVQDQTSRQTEPRVTLFAPDASRMHGFGTITGSNGRAADLAALPAGSVFINHSAANALDAHRGDTIGVLAGDKVLVVRVADVVSYNGAGTAKAAMIAPLAQVQTALHAPGQVEQILVSNEGGTTSGSAHTDAVVARLRPALDPLGLEAQPLKHDGLDAADKAGESFITMFTTFGSFSIVAGILLIFLIFVMLAAERRSEMGVARAIGTRRGHLVEMFVFEGAAYDVVAAAVGALLGVAVSLGMVAAIGRTFSAESLDVVYSIRWPSLVVAYAIGVLLTFLVVGVSAWRVSVLNIVTAVRNLPEPLRRGRGRRGWVIGSVTVLFGVLMASSGRSSAQAMPFLLGLSLIAVGLVPLLRRARVPDRLSYTAAGVAIVVLWMLPFRMVETMVPGAQMGFSSWVVGGVLIVLGAVWVVIYNADALLGATNALLGRVRALAAVLKISMAYPLRSRLRTGMTLAMFTLVVFNLVVGIITPTSFLQSFSDTKKFGGGYDVQAATAPSSPITDLASTLRHTPGIDPRAVRTTGSVSVVPVSARQADANAKFVDYPVRGLDTNFTANNGYALGSRATGYATDRAVWDAIASGKNYAVVDPWIVPHRRNWSFGALSDMTLSGFYAEDPTFAPVPLDVRDPATNKVTRFTIIGVLRDSMPQEMAGIDIAQTQARALFGARAVPTIHFVGLAPGVNADHFAKQMESAFLANGLEANSFRKLVNDATAASMVFLRLIEGFMALGLVVGVAALGVIAARSVVERRQQIGVLRSIGFQASTVRLGFLLESAFLALTSILIGLALGLALSYNIIDDGRRQATWPGVQMVVPWLNLVIVFVVVLAIALATTYVPARRASRIYPAEALRYE